VTNKLKQLEQLQNEREELASKEANFLRSQGWVYTCDTPGSTWLWSCLYKGCTILVNRETALSFEEAFLSGVYDRG